MPKTKTKQKTKPAPRKAPAPHPAVPKPRPSRPPRPPIEANTALSVYEQFNAIISESLEALASVQTSKESYSDALQQLIDEAGLRKDAIDRDIEREEQGRYGGPGPVVDDRSEDDDDDAA